METGQFLVSLLQTTWSQPSAHLPVQSLVGAGPPGVIPHLEHTPSGSLPPTQLFKFKSKLSYIA